MTGARWIVAAATSLTALSAGVASQAGDTLTPDARLETVEAVAAIVEREYFDEQAAGRLAGALRRHAGEGRYDSLSTLDALAAALTRDLRSVTADQHLHVGVVQRPRMADTAPRQTDEERAAAGRAVNWNIGSPERLSGNIGYLELRGFYRLSEARETLAAAMATLGDTDAFVLDLRENGGGAPDTAAFLVGYFLDEPGIPLFEIRPRRGASMMYAADAGVLAGRSGARPAYVLTSARTFSAGEGVAFLLQERGRALVVGEPTPGAANPGRAYPAGPHIDVTVPNGQVRSAVSGGNWQGRGVVPDVRAPASDARRVAHLRALRDLLARNPAADVRERLEKAIAVLEAGGRMRLADPERRPIGDPLNGR